MEKILSAIFGESCYFCGRLGQIICYSCLHKIKTCNNSVCIKCQRQTILGFTHIYCQNESQNYLPSQLCVIYEYEGFVSEVVKKSKYNPKRFSLLKFLSKEGAKAAAKIGFDFRDFVVVPIPISKTREKERGFNQAEIIAKAVAKEFGLVMDNSILVRARETNKQSFLTKEERARNLLGAFEVKEKSLGFMKVKNDKNKFLLVDDVCTTGSTLIAASLALYKAGAGDVRCFALSRKF